MKSATDRQQVHSIRWRGELETEECKWSPTQQLLLIILFILAIAL
ncbi:hypothetical protein [Sporomusa sp.]|nr:hypothetical protein [Sporomusa sp.]HWR07787.1 hypothetical protein [Sporomusa sp.]